MNCYAINMLIINNSYKPTAQLFIISKCMFSWSPVGGFKDVYSRLLAVGCTGKAFFGVSVGCTGKPASALAVLM